MLNQWILFGLLQEGNGIRTLESFCLREEERLDEFFEKKTSIAKGSSMVSLATNSREPFTRFFLADFFFWADQSGTTSFWRHFLKNHHALYTIYILIYEKDNWIYISVHFTINLSDKIDLKIGFLLKKLDTLEYIMDIFGYGRPKKTIHSRIKTIVGENVLLNLMKTTPTESQPWRPTSKADLSA